MTKVIYVVRNCAPCNASSPSDLRKTTQAGSKPERKVTGKDLVREYERHVQRQKTLLRRASVISHRLALLTSTLKRLRSDEHFVTLLRAESLEKLPEALSKRLA